MNRCDPLKPDEEVCQRAAGVYHEGHMRCVREQKRNEARIRERLYAAKTSQGNPTGKHIWKAKATNNDVPVLVCIRPQCTEIWKPSHVRRPTTTCPKVKVVEQSAQRS